MKIKSLGLDFIPKSQMDKQSVINGYFQTYLYKEMLKIALNTEEGDFTSSWVKDMFATMVAEKTGIERVSYLNKRNRGENIYAFKAFGYTKENIKKIIETEAKKNSIEPSLVMAIVEVESNFNPNAVSPKGAKGLMQIMDSTAKELNLKDPFDPYENIKSGIKHLKYLMKKYNNDLEKVIAAYNAGAGAVDKYKGIPPYKETINYVEKVKRAKMRYEGKVYKLYSDNREKGKGEKNGEI